MPPTGEMMQVQRELGQITQALRNADEHRTEVTRRLDMLSGSIEKQHDNINAMRGAVANMEQSVKSSGQILTNIVMEKYGERLDHLEALCKNFPTIETELMFWKRVLGGGVHALWKIVALLVSAGFVGAAINRWIQSPVLPHVP